MHLNPYGSDAVLLAVDLVSNPPRTAADLDERCRAHGVVVELRTKAPDLATPVHSGYLEAYLDRRFISPWERQPC